jgi:hypothetical protein
MGNEGIPFEKANRIANAIAKFGEGSLSLSEEHLMQDEEIRNTVYAIVDRYRDEAYLQNVTSFEKLKKIDPFVKDDDRESVLCIWNNERVTFRAELKYNGRTKRGVLEIKQYDDESLYGGSIGCAHQTIVKEDFYDMIRSDVIYKCKCILKSNGCPSEKLESFM